YLLDGHGFADVNHFGTPPDVQRRALYPRKQLRKSFQIEESGSSEALDFGETGLDRGDIIGLRKSCFAAINGADPIRKGGLRVDLPAEHCVVEVAMRID